MTSKARDIADLGSNDVLETTATGVDVTGTVTADGLTLQTSEDIVSWASGNGIVQAPSNLYVRSSGTGDVILQSDSKQIAKFSEGGDVSFYEDTGTTAKMVWDASAEELEIGVSTEKLELGSTYYRFKKDNENKFLIGNTSSALGSGTGLITYMYQSEPIIWTHGSTERMRIDSSGNVGIATVPKTWQSQSNALEIGELSIEDYEISGSNATNILFNGYRDTDNSFKRKVDGYSVRVGSYLGDFAVQLYGTGSADEVLTGSPALRLDSSGNLLVGKTTTGLVNKGAMSFSVGTSGYSGSLAINHSTSNVNGSGFINFARDQAYIGSINQVGTSGVSYNTTSDYRLKENVAPMDNASERVKALKPCRFNFIADPDSTVDGFLAHEAQEVVPEAVHGSKDAMRTEEYEVSPAVEATYDEDGNELTPAVEAVMGTREVPDYQGIDQSKLVPLLTKALQEALTRIEALENANGNS